MFLRTSTLKPITLAGFKASTSLNDPTLVELWKNFMIRRKDFEKLPAQEIYSVEIYPTDYFKNFSPETRFKKWACMEISEQTLVPPDMEILTIPPGLYAVFLHKGNHAGAQRTYERIFREWLPEKKFIADDRPHFAIMGERYKHDDPESEEEIWIPIRT